MEVNDLHSEVDLKVDYEVLNAICRCCLSTDRKMKNVLPYEPYFRDLAGFSVMESDGLPQWLCLECIALLLKAVRFKQKMLRAHNLLYEYLTRCAPFPIDAQDPELIKYASPHLVATDVLTCSVGARGEIDFQEYLLHKRQPPSDFTLDAPLPAQVLPAQVLPPPPSPLPEEPEQKTEVKEEQDEFDCDYDDITLEEYRTSTKLTDEDIKQLLEDSTPAETIEEPEPKRKKKSKKKEAKEKKKKVSADAPEVEEPKTSIRKRKVLDPTKIRANTLNPEEQHKQKEVLEVPAFPAVVPRAARTIPNVFLHLAPSVIPGVRVLEFKKHQLAQIKNTPASPTLQLASMEPQCTAKKENNTRIIQNHVGGYDIRLQKANKKKNNTETIIDEKNNTLLDPKTKKSNCKTDKNNDYMSGDTKTTTSDQINHIGIHTGEKQYQCSTCSKAFSQKSAFITHIRIHTGEKPYQCSTCSKAFRLKATLIRHIRIHTGEKPYQCSTCSKAFCRKSDLIKHIRIHTGEKPYQCSVCSKAFVRKSSFTIHMKRHTGETPYQCSVCSKAFSDSSALIKHIRIHTGEKPYQCSTCSKAFRQKSSLITHIRIHTGEKPYQCSVCGKAFVQKTYLTIHKRIHTGEKPYQCSTCSKAFGEKSNLIRHIKIHTGKKQAYQCSTCSKAFSNKKSLTTHMNIHTDAR